MINIHSTQALGKEKSKEQMICISTQNRSISHIQAALDWCYHAESSKYFYFSITGDEILWYFEDESDATIFALRWS